MTRHITAALCFSLLLAGCETTTAAGSSGTSAQAVTATDDNTYLCEEDAPTGSHMRTKECRSRAQKKEEKRSAEQFLTKPAQSPTPGK